MHFAKTIQSQEPDWDRQNHFNLKEKIIFCTFWLSQSVLFLFCVSKIYLLHNAQYIHPISVTLTVSKKLYPWTATWCNGRNCKEKMQQLIFILRETPCGLLVVTEVETSSVVWSPWPTSHCIWDLRQHKHSWLDTQYTVYPFMLIRWKLLLLNFS